MMKYTLLFAAFSISGLIGGCGVSPKNVVVQDGATTYEIMRGTGGEVADATQRTNSGPTARLVGTTSIGHESYTRDAINETRQLFPTLPNPTLALYVQAHMVVDTTTGESLPIPGYTTAFPLYDRVQHALPGELPSSREPVTRPFPVAHPRDTGVPLSDTRRSIR